MKKLLMLALFSALCCSATLPAYCAAEASPAASAQVVYMRTILSTLDNMNALMGTVTDKAHADAAAPALRHMLRSMRALSTSATTLKAEERLSPAAERETRAMGLQYLDKVAEFERRVEALRNNSYGSSSLAEVLQVIK